jgi:hypothetical protein
MGLASSDFLGVYCLEGRWSYNPLYEWSVTPILELLARERRIHYLHHGVKRVRRLKDYASDFADAATTTSSTSPHTASPDWSTSACSASSSTS